MKKRRVWLCLIVVFLLTAVVLLAFFEPNRILRGLLAGEPFYRERPSVTGKTSFASTGDG